MKPTPTLHDIIDDASFAYEPSLTLWGIVVLIGGVLLVVAFLATRRTSRVRPIASDPLSITLRALEEAQTGPEPHNESLTQMSLITRRFLAHHGLPLAATMSSAELTVASETADQALGALLHTVVEIERLRYSPGQQQPSIERLAESLRKQLHAIGGSS